MSASPAWGRGAGDSARHPDSEATSVTQDEGRRETALAPERMPRSVTTSPRAAGWRVNAKRIYRLYGLKASRCARNRERSWRAVRVPSPCPRGPMRVEVDCERPLGGRSLVPDPNRAGSLHTRVVGACRRSIADGRQGRGGARPRAAAASSATGDHRSTMAASLSAAPWTRGPTRTTLGFHSAGKPVENAFIDSFNGKLRDDCLHSHVFASIAEAQVVLDAWREDYNAVRPTARCRIGRRPRWAPCGSPHVVHVSRLRSRMTGPNSRPQALQSRFSRSGFPGQVNRRLILLFL